MSEQSVLQKTTIDVDGGVQHLQCAIDESMQKHWKIFTQEYTFHYEQFRKNYVEPSIAFIETQKENADKKYNTLKDIHKELQLKFHDVSRYNALLMEKVDALEMELKSFSQVSLIAKFEKRCRDKTVECEQTQSRHNALKSKYQKLQKENLLLNSRLEQKPSTNIPQPYLTLVSKPQSAHTPANTSNIFTDTDTDTQPNTTVSRKSASHRRSSSKLSSFVDSFVSKTHPHIPIQTETVFQNVQKDNCIDGVNNCISKTVEERQNTNYERVMGDETIELTTNAALTEVHTDQECVNTPKNCTIRATEKNEIKEGRETTVEKEKSVDTPKKNIPREETSTTVGSTLQESTKKKTVDTKNDMSLEKENNCEKRMTYIVKKLKRRKVDSEKQNYLLGTDQKLYVYIDEKTAGEEVGHQIEKNGKKIFKFYKIV